MLSERRRKRFGAIKLTYFYNKWMEGKEAFKFWWLLTEKNRKGKKKRRGILYIKHWLIVGKGEEPHRTKLDI